MPITIICAYCGRPFFAKPYIALRPRACCSEICACAIKTTDPIKRFWSKVDKRGPDECWPWLAGKGKDGYGSFTAASRKTIGAHCFAYILAHGPIPKRLQVLHSCDNPPCCNPAHLWLGTALDNNRDSATKRRRAYGERHGSHVHPERVARGERNGNARLKTADILHIREMCQQGMTETKIAHLFNISQGVVSRIILRKSWKHI